MKFSIKTLGEVGKVLLDELPDFFSNNSENEIVMVFSFQNSILKTENGYQIDYIRVSDGWMLLGDLLFGNGTPLAAEIPNRGVMLDASRNAVPTISYLKTLLVRLALCGLNRFCLYTEDTYKVESEPLFGYGRGGYSDAELRELDRFSALLGIELFPCIQTLGHFEQVLRYAAYGDFQDNPRVVNTQSEAVYIWLEKLILSASSPFHSKRIHVGLDEPWGLGRGKALNFDDLKRPGTVFAAHATRINALCRKHGLEPMIWGDYPLGHSGETPLSGSEVQQLPQDLKMVYWDYDSEDPDHYRRNIAAFRAMGYEPVCAPSAHNYNRFFPDWNRVEKTAGVFLDVAAECGIQEMLLTCWGDDGHECLAAYTLPMMLWALSTARGFQRDPTHFAVRCRALTGLGESQLRILSKISDPELLVDGDPTFAVSGKMLLWDDPLHRFVSRLLSTESVESFESVRWDRSEERLRKPLYALAECYCSLICLKVSLTFRITDAYRRADRSDAAVCAGMIPELIQLIETFHAQYRKLWLQERKPFGLEIMDHRFGGLLMRVRIWKETVLNWCHEEIPLIPELEDIAIPHGLVRADLSFHNRIFTRCYQLWG